MTADPDVEMMKRLQREQGTLDDLAAQFRILMLGLAAEWTSGVEVMDKKAKGTHRVQVLALAVWRLMDSLIVAAKSIMWRSMVWCCKAWMRPAAPNLQVFRLSQLATRVLRLFPVARLNTYSASMTQMPSCLASP